jgi:hypothetical protein
MNAWLNGPGKAFRDPLPGSTNYLSAYNRQGQLIRSKREEKTALSDPLLDESETSIQAREQEEGVSQEMIKQRALEREKRREERREMEARGGLPRERQSDLRPYPLNQQFRSQSVLSEELREKIYKMVVAEGIDLKAVSAMFSVDVRRVAAVVRLMTMEKTWVEEVSYMIHFLESVWREWMMSTIQKSISLEDFYMVTKICFASLSDPNSIAPFYVEV